MREAVRPLVVVSRCLDFEACRYNGQVIPNEFIRQLAAHATLVPVCPEVEIGLGVPREPIRLVRDGARTRAIQSVTGQDVTPLLEDFAERFLGALSEVDGFILKSRSPSCGIRDAKVFPSVESQQECGRQAGIFATRVFERFPGMLVEDEGRLQDERIRDHFLTNLFTRARFRQAVGEGTLEALLRFHATHKFVILARSQTALRTMGRILAHGADRPLEDVVSDYRRHLFEALRQEARRPAVVNVLQHGFGYVSRYLTAREKAFFLHLLERYRRGRLPLNVVTHVLRAWILRYEISYLLAQTFFEPYPEDLAGPVDIRRLWEDLSSTRRRRRPLRP